MNERGIVVLDASVGVKWFKEEAGREEARAMLAKHRDGMTHIVVPVHFMHEVMAVATRHYGRDFATEAWHHMADAGIITVGLDDRLVKAALQQVDDLGCSFYDALAPALAQALKAPLVSADARAHGGFEGVQIIG